MYDFMRQLLVANLVFVLRISSVVCFFVSKTTTMNVYLTPKMTINAPVFEKSYHQHRNKTTTTTPTTLKPHWNHLVWWILFGNNQLPSMQFTLYAIYSFGRPNDFDGRKKQQIFMVLMCIFFVRLFSNSLNGIIPMKAMWKYIFVICMKKKSVLMWWSLKNIANW